MTDSAKTSKTVAAYIFLKIFKFKLPATESENMHEVYHRCIFIFFLHGRQLSALKITVL